MQLRYVCFNAHRSVPCTTQRLFSLPAALRQVWQHDYVTHRGAMMPSEELTEEAQQPIPLMWHGTFTPTSCSQKRTYARDGGLLPHVLERDA